MILAGRKIVERCKRNLRNALSCALDSLVLAASPLLLLACTDNAIKGNLGFDGGKTQIAILSPTGHTDLVGDSAKFTLTTNRGLTPTSIEAAIHTGAGCSGEYEDLKILTPSEGSIELTDIKAGVVQSALLTPYNGIFRGEGVCTPTFLKPMQIEVTSVYPNNSSWNDYVKNNNGGTTPFDQPDLACDGSETGSPSACIHGGEKRKVIVPGITSCANLEISDALSAFDWTCISSDGVTAFYSRGLKSKMGLRNLINASGFLNNSVSIRQNGNLLAESAPAVWGWANAFSALPDNSAASPIKLDGVDDDGTGPDNVFQAGTIFTLSSSRVSRGYNLNLNKISIVTLDDSVLRYADGGSNNCNLGNGENDASNNCLCLLSAGTEQFLWTEGSFDGFASARAHQGIYFKSVNFSQFKNLSVRNASDHGIKLNSSSFNRFDHVAVDSSLSKGMNWTGSNGNSLNGGAFANNSGYGFGIDTSTNNRVHQSSFSNNGTDGLFVGTSEDNVFTGIVANNNGAAGVHVSSSLYNTMGFITSFNNSVDGYTVTSTSDYNTIFQLISTNNGDKGLYLESADYNKFSNIVMVSNTNYGLYLTGSGSYWNSFQDNALFGTNSANTSNDCIWSGSTSNNEISSSCTSSTANISRSLSLAGSLLGKLTTEDLANSSDLLGVSLFSSILDFTNFDNAFRGWGRDGLALADPSNRGRCTSASCRIWDMSLKAGDSVLLNKSNDGVSINAPFAPGGSCPPAVHGNKSVIDSQTIPNTFLANAFELVDDGVGDEDGLCETGESCLYAPNFGAYQGSGDYLAQTCTFSSGAVSNVTIYGYLKNGE
jgi:hypothetical protein